MKIPSVLRPLLFIALAALLAVGCAKKPVADQAAAEVAATPTTEMTSQEISGVDQQAISEQGVTDEVAAPTMAVTGLQRVFFDFDQYTLTPEARETLAANAAYLQANPGVQVRIEGHCDERGSDEYNLALGERRAMAALNYLTSLGIEKGRLSTISYGEEMPLDPGHGEAAWAKNRRAEFKVLR